MFKSRVVSRKHAELFMQDGKLFIKDTRSSSGTFINEVRLSARGEESVPIQVKNGDVIRLGDDCDQQDVQYNAVVFKVNYESDMLGSKDKLAFPSLRSLSIEELNNSQEFLDLTQDKRVQQNVEEDMQAIWTQITSGTKPLITELKELAKPLEEYKAIAFETKDQFKPKELTLSIQKLNQIRAEDELQTPKQGALSHLKHSSSGITIDHKNKIK
ncbi:hypothetical protein EDD86DRAFT_205868 [Gorgonomyces haynaldii]|nr:hypothetical protein EDD86DRAFT_205868 [Gorgonomyces haynaldii]